MMPPAASRSRRSLRSPAAFTLIEILLALSLVGLVLVSLNTFIFSMGELWGKNQDVRLFEQHVRAVTRFLENELRTAAFPPAAVPGGTPITVQEIRPQSGSMENLLTFELPEGNRLIRWPDHPLPEVVCSLQADERSGLRLLWHSRLETRFNDDPPRETVITPLVTALAYDYYDPAFKNWKTETQPQRDTENHLLPPQRLRLTFTYGTMTRETVVTLPILGEGWPAF
jgi:prepilin-type N-terminal cleavage/methylation domain-containing protein